MSGDSNLGSDSHFAVHTRRGVLRVLGPLEQLVFKDPYNPPEIPANAIIHLLTRTGNRRSDLGGKYFILDKEASSSITSQKNAAQDKIFNRVCLDVRFDLV